MGASVTRIGLNDDDPAQWQQDHLEHYVAQRLHKTLLQERHLLQALDKLISMVQTKYLQESHESVTRPLKQFVVRLLSLRHMFLDSVYYQRQQQETSMALSEIRVIIGTPSKILEGRAGLTTWVNHLKTDDTVGIAVDEYQQGPNEYSIALGLGCSFKILMGDADQRKDSGGHQRDIGGDNVLGTATIKPFQTRGAPEWYRANQKVQRIDLPETLRLGPTGVRILQAMFPQRHQQKQQEWPETRALRRTHRRRPPSAPYACEL